MSNQEFRSLCKKRQRRRFIEKTINEFTIPLLIFIGFIVLRLLVNGEF